MSYRVAGIDVHKKFVIAGVGEVSREMELEYGRFETTTAELRRLATWLQEREVQEVVMESTAQYWKPVWLELEAYFRMHLAQAKSNRGPRGRKNDYADTQRLVRRFVAGELILSYVPEASQRDWRTLTRSKHQLTRDRVRLQSQIECLLEEMRIKLSSVISDLLGASGRRMLWALANGESDPEKLADLGDDRLKCSREQLLEAISGRAEAIHRKLLKLYLERLTVLDGQIEEIHQLIADCLKAQGEAVQRLAEVPGLGVDSAQQIIAEVGSEAKAFDTPAQLASWGGFCPGEEESAGENHNARCPKGNKYVRRILNQAAQAAVKKKGSHFQVVFRRLLSRLGYQKAIWAIARRICVVVWKILHEGVRFIERGECLSPQGVKRRAQRLTQALRRLGYLVEIKPITPATQAAQA